MKKISVITVNLNNRSGLEKTIQSVAGQTASAYEHIVIDGSSQDGSKELLENCRLPRLKWISEKDEGIYDAMNKAIRLSSGDYLLFLNSGDVLADPKILSLAGPYLDRKDDIVYGNLQFENESGVSEGFMPDRIDLDHMMRDTLWHPSAFIKKDLFLRSGSYDTSFRLCGDYEFFFRTLIAEGATSSHIPLFIARFSMDGLTSDLKNHPLVNEEKARVHRRFPEFAGKWKPAKPGFISKLRRWFR